MARDVLVALLDIEDPHAGDAARTTSGSVGYTPKLRNPGKMAGAIHVAPRALSAQGTLRHPLGAAIGQGHQSVSQGSGRRLRPCWHRRSRVGEATGHSTGAVSYTHLTLPTNRE